MLLWMLKKTKGAGTDGSKLIYCSVLVRLSIAASKLLYSVHASDNGSKHLRRAVLLLVLDTASAFAVHSQL